MTTSTIGDDLEIRIHDLFQKEIDADRFWAKKENCKVFRKKGYFSKDRNTAIVFDVAVEIYLPGALEYSMLVLIECKNYTHSVPVDDIEEFFAKVQQVAAAKAKAVIASTASFQSGTRTYARSKGIGLMRYFNQNSFKWELQRSPSAAARTDAPESDHRIQDGLAQQDFQSHLFDLYLQSPARATISLWDFIEDIVIDAGVSAAHAQKIVNKRAKSANQVPFRGNDELECLGATMLSEIGYVRGEVAIQAICAREGKRKNLVVRMAVEPSDSPVERMALGRITFDPPLIEVFQQASLNRGRERFTLAHELSHHLLGHGRYLVREVCDDSDFVLERTTGLGLTEIARMEFQANVLAAILLMPRRQIVEDFVRLLKRLDIPDKGFGLLYVDNQPCNRHAYGLVTGSIMENYGVSRTAAKIRLQSLGLLTDARDRNSFRSVQAVLSTQ